MTSARSAEEDRERRQGHDLGQEEEGQHRERLRQPDRRAVARRKHERVQQPLVSLGSERSQEPEERGEDERHPEQTVGSEVRARRRQRRRALPSRILPNRCGRAH